MICDTLYFGDIDTSICLFIQLSMIVKRIAPNRSAVFSTFIMFGSGGYILKSSLKFFSKRKSYFPHQKKNCSICITSLIYKTSKPLETDQRALKTFLFQSVAKVLQKSIAKKTGGFRLKTSLLSI